jgi:hypothetical protein
MLSYVGSEIDEMKMDHLTFFKIYHTLQSHEDNIRYDQLVSLDIKQQALLMPVSAGQENLLGISNLYNSTGVVKALALLDST